MKSKEQRKKKDRLRSAALVKLKYQMQTGNLDSGFKTIFGGVLKELSLEESEVDQFINENLSELEKVCGRTRQTAKQK